MPRIRPPKDTLAFSTPSVEKLARLRVKPQIKMTPVPPPARQPNQEQAVSDEGNPLEFPPLPPPPLIVRTMPLQVKMLADSLVSNPSDGLKVHAATAGMTIPQARHALLREDVRTYIGDVLDRAGATVSASCTAIAEALQAVRIVGMLPNKDNPEEKIPLHAPDHEYRLRAAELNLKLRGLLHKDDDAEQPLTLAALIVAIQQERARRALDVTPCSSPPSGSRAPRATGS